MSDTVKDYKTREAIECAVAAQYVVVERIGEMVKDIRDIKNLPSYKNKSFLPVEGVDGATGIVIIGKRSSDLFPHFEIQSKAGWTIDPYEASLRMLASLSLALSKMLVKA